VTPSGIEPATFRLVAQCLNQLRPRVPPAFISIVNVSSILFQKYLVVQPCHSYIPHNIILSHSWLSVIMSNLITAGLLGCNITTSNPGTVTGLSSSHDLEGITNLRKLTTHLQSVAFQKTWCLGIPAVRTWNLEFFIVYDLFSCVEFQSLDLFMSEDLKGRKVCCTQLVPLERASLWIPQIRVWQKSRRWMCPKVGVMFIVTALSETFKLGLAI
jgi:hypothetical protein